MKKYFIIYEDIKNKILSGEFKLGAKLFSKRICADKYGVSLITVERAYSMLEEEGYIVSKERKGYFVNLTDGVFQKNDISKKPAHLKEPSEHSKQDFEYSVWFKTIRKVISDEGDRLFVKAPSEGCEVLRNAICDYLYRYRGMMANPERIIIGSGAEQLYENVVKILGHDKIYGIEEPSYNRIRSVYEGMNAKVEGLLIGEDGIKSRELSKRFDILHVTPFYSFPSGISTSVSKRYEYLKWASDNNGIIIEDDFASEFFVPGQPRKTLFELCDNDSVIYINTFSKSLSPAMRIGYMILPEALMGEYKKTLGGFSCSVPVMDQYILAEFINNGSFERHLNRIRRKMKK